MLKPIGRQGDLADALLRQGDMQRIRDDPADARFAYIEACRLYDGLDDMEGLICSIEGLAGLEVETRAEWSVLLFGGAAALREAHGLRVGDWYGFNADLAELRRRLGFVAFARALASGAGLKRQELVAVACGEEVPDRLNLLTSAERAVARLVARGLTTAEVARRLDVSPRTVQAHLTRCFAKLGVSSRTALAFEVNSQEQRVSGSLVS